MALKYGMNAKFSTNVLILQKDLASSSKIIQLINFLNTWVCLAPLQSQSIFSLMFTYVTLYFTVGPLDVELIGRKDPVSVGRLYEFRCQSVGARPPPHVTWWRGSIQLRENVTSRVSNNNNSDGFRVLNIKPENSGFLSRYNIVCTQPKSWGSTQF